MALDLDPGRERIVLRALVREEYRLHARLFGGRRFALFPALVACLVAGGAVALEATGTDPETGVVGLHLLVLAFGLYSGTAGFVGSDMLENVFGSLSMVLSTATVLPLSRRRLLGAFLLKDAAYYGALFVAPAAVGALPLLEVSSPAPLAVALGGVAGSLWLAFVAGMTATVAGIALRTRGTPAPLLLAGGAAVAGTLVLTEYRPPLWAALVTDGGTPLEAVALWLAVGIVAIAAIAVYDPTYARPERTATDRFARVDAALPGSGSGSRRGAGEDGTDRGAGLVAKTLLDLARSSGGVWKPLVSAAILLALVWALVDVVRSITGVDPAPGVFFGGVLGLTAFTTYSWLTGVDRVEDYLAYPVSVTDVFRAKRTAFVLVEAPTVAVPYLVAIARFEATALDAVAGAVVLAGYALYYFGLTVFVAGFDPNEFLFDPLRFGTFAVGVAVALVPALVVGFAVPVTAPVALALAAAGVCVGGVGLGLSRRAGPRWERRYRRGTATDRR